MHSSHTPLISRPAAKIHGLALVPGDKSISHRALMLASQVLGTTSISGLLEGEDVLNTARALQAMGVPITRISEGKWQVHGVGAGGLKESTDALDMGNSGTSARLMMGLVSPYPFTIFFTGDASLSKRPMLRVITPLSQTGATFLHRDGGRLPLAVQGTAAPIPVEYRLPVASAQVKSALLLAGLNIRGTTTVIEPHATRDHTENMLKYFGYHLDIEKNNSGETTIRIAGHQNPPRMDRTLEVPADPSSAAFYVVAALITQNSEIHMKNVCMNAARTGLFTTLLEMGAAIRFDNEREVAGERVADITVKSSRLRGVRVPAARAPSMIDEYPILAVAAAFAEGETVMEGLAELKVKESDRLSAIAAGLAENGVKASVSGDNLTVFGGAVAGGGVVKTHFDHRIAMSFLVMGMAAKAPVTVDDGTAIATSFPGFVERMNGLGASISVVSQGNEKPLVIAIDGPAASGKGTLARRIAEYLDLAYLDTGSLYRAVGLKLEYAGLDPADEKEAVKAAENIELTDLANPRLRQEHIGKAASIVSAMPGVRAALLEFQRKIGRTGRGAVLDGRDIGTVVFPEADFKFYLTANMEARARRRHRELSGQGFEVIYDSVLEDLLERDARDSARDIAPLKPAADAIIIDTSTMDANSVFEKVKRLVSVRENR